MGALESAIGLTLLESQAVNAGYPTSAEVFFWLNFLGGAVGEDGKTNLTLTSLKGRYVDEPICIVLTGEKKIKE